MFCMLVGVIDPSLAARARPTSTSDSQMLPVVEPLRTLLPGGLPRGITISVEGSGATTLAFGLIAAATSQGSWCAIAGLDAIGFCAAAELGVDLGRLAVVANQGDSWDSVVAALLDGADAVVLLPPAHVRPATARRLAARARARRSVLVVLGDSTWPEGPEIRLVVQEASWHGCGSDHSPLRARRAKVVRSGRRGAAQPVATELWLPSPTGKITSSELPSDGSHARKDGEGVE